MNSDLKVGLALGGGSFRGIAHIGVLRALEEANIPIHCIAGTSIGAWAAVYYALHQDVDDLEHAFMGNKKNKLKALLDPSIRGGLVAGKRALNLLESHYGKGTQFSDLQIPTSAVATDLISSDEVVLTEGSVVDAVRASISIPLVFAPYKLNGQLLVDGVVSNPVPVDVVRGMGADVIIAVDLDPVSEITSIKSFKSNLRSVGMRSFQIMQRRLTYKDDGPDVIWVRPHIELTGAKGWSKYFTDKSIADVSKKGATAMKQQLPEVQERLS